jgi:type I restriction enzyme S subunit
VRIDSIADGKLTDINSLRRVKVSPIIEQRFELKKDDILINRVNALSHIGKAALIPQLNEPTVFESNMIRLRCGSRLLPEFLIIVLCSDIARRHWLKRAKPAVNQVSINQRDVRDLPIPISKIDEQREIANIVLTSTNQIEKLVAIERAYSNLKRSLMHDLLTGRKRVKDIKVATPP